MYGIYLIGIFICLIREPSPRPDLDCHGMIFHDCFIFCLTILNKYLKYFQKDDLFKVFILKMLSYSDGTPRWQWISVTWLASFEKCSVTQKSLNCASLKKNGQPGETPPLCPSQDSPCCTMQFPPPQGTLAFLLWNLRNCHRGLFYFCNILFV